MADKKGIVEPKEQPKPYPDDTSFYGSKEDTEEFEKQLQEDKKKHD